LFEAFKLEIVLLVVGLVLVRFLWRIIKKKQGPDLRKSQKIDQIEVPLKYRPEWIMLGISILFTLILGYAAIIEYGKDDFRETFSQFGATLLVVIGAWREGVKTLFVQIANHKLKINHNTYQADKLNQVELWDDLVYLKTRKGKEVKVWLNYQKENFPDMVKAMNLIKKFCADQKIPLEDHFDTNIETNTAFNEEVLPPKSLRERWEDFSKIPPREKLPD